MERNYSTHETLPPLFSFRSVVAGLLVASFIFTGLVGLGFAIGGISLNQDTTFGGIGMFSGIWFGASVLISLFLGSYFAARISRFQSGRVGSAQGLIIASLFMGFFVYQAGQTFGEVSSLATSFIGGSVNLAGKGVQKASQNEDVRDTFNSVIQNTIGDLNLKSEIQTVAINVGNRLYRGDEQGAINYLSEQSGISQEEAKAKLSKLRVQAQEAVGDAKNMAGNAMKATGWTLFLLVLLGTISSTIGGALGSRANAKSLL